MTQIIRRLILAFALMAGIAPAVAQVPPPVPALPDTERRTTYSISASTCACAVGFQLYGDSTDYTNWVEVWINGSRITQAGNWTITSPTGSLATIPRPITDAVLTFTTAQTGTVQIVGARRPRRTSQFSENRGVAARDLNQVLTDIVTQNRETWDKINDVSGRTVLAPPGETLSILAAATNRANQGACFDGSGNLVACVAVPSTTLTAGNGIALTGVGSTTITNNIQGSGPITIAGSNPLIISCATCNTTPAGTSAVISSRTTAITLDLSAYTVVKTLGYATGGDGGSATYTKVASSTPFLDSYISVAATTNAGSGYTNGTYLGVPLTGTGTIGSCLAQVTVAGGAVTSISTTMPCAASSVGSVLTTSNTFIGGTGSGFAWTVSAVSTPKSSFIDSAGNHWQFVEEGGSTNALQFGCKGDWGGIGSDASSTNNSPCLWSALAFVSLKSGWVGGYGGHLVIPKGAFMTCGQFLASGFNIPIPQSVRVSGTSIFGTTLAECAADSGTTHYVGLCDAVAKVGQFGCKIENITLYLWQVTTASANISAIYSNSGQQFVLAENVEVDAYHRNCVKYESGAGGAANDIWIGIDCIQEGTATNPGFVFSSNTSQHILQRSVCASGPAGAAVCITNNGGRLLVDGMDIEGYGLGLQYQVNTASLIGSYKNVQEQSASCTAAIQLTPANLAGNLVIENVSTGCPITVLNQQAGGVNFVGNIRGPTMCVAGACAAAVP